MSEQGGIDEGDVVGNSQVVLPHALFHHVRADRGSPRVQLGRRTSLAYDGIHDQPAISGTGTSGALAAPRFRLLVGAPVA